MLIYKSFSFILGHPLFLSPSFFQLTSTQSFVNLFIHSFPFDIRKLIFWAWRGKLKCLLAWVAAWIPLVQGRLLNPQSMQGPVIKDFMDSCIISGNRNNIYKLSKGYQTSTMKRTWFQCRLVWLQALGFFFMFLFYLGPGHMGMDFLHQSW